MTKLESTPNATRWTLILRAQGVGAERRGALGELLGHYEGYLVWLIRHYGHPPDQSADELKQEFLEGMLRRNDIAKLDRERGSFRAWLSLAVRRFVANQWDNWRTARAGRRDTGALPVELPDGGAEADDAATREFAGQVVLRALELQRGETRDKARFDALARFLPGPQMDLVELAPLARSLGTTQTALAKAICLLRARYRELLRESIRDLLDLGTETADSANHEGACALAIDEELRDLRRHFWS